MSYLEELLPEFRRGAKIRQNKWKNDAYIERYAQGIFYHNVEEHDIDILADDYELYKEPEPNWDSIIKNKCLCWFWDYNKSKKRIGILKSINKYETYKFSIVTPDNYVGDVSFVNCRPVRRDEVTFYEDRKGANYNDNI